MNDWFKFEIFINTNFCTKLNKGQKGKIFLKQYLKETWHLNRRRVINHLKQSINNKPTSLHTYKNYRNVKHSIKVNIPTTTKKPPPQQQLQLTQVIDKDPTPITQLIYLTTIPKTISILLDKTLIPICGLLIGDLDVEAVDTKAV